MESTKDKTLLKCLSFLADLNGSEWITGDNPGTIDMRQRAKALQQLVFDATREAGNDEVANLKAEITRLKSLIYEFADKIKSV